MLKLIIMTLFLSAQTPAPLNLTYNPKAYASSQADLVGLMSLANDKLEGVQKLPSMKVCNSSQPNYSLAHLDQDHVCFVPPPQRTFTDYVFDPKDVVSTQITSANDGDLFKVKDENDPTKQHTLSNDTGYTLGGNVKAIRENAERLMSFEFDTKLFTGRTIGPNGRARTLDGKYYLDTHEITRFNIYAEDKSRSDGLRAVGQVGIREDSKRSDGVGATLQDKWHDNLDRYNDLRYEQLAGDYSKATLEAQVGMKKILETDVGQFHCMAAVTAMAGVDSSGNPLFTAKVEAQISSGTMAGRDKSTPLFLLKAYQDAHYRGREKSTDMRLELGSNFYVKNGFSAYAGVGRGRYVTNAAPGILKDKEPINYIVLRANKKF